MKRLVVSSKVIITAKCVIFDGSLWSFLRPGANSPPPKSSIESDLMPLLARWRSMPALGEDDG